MSLKTRPRFRAIFMYDIRLEHAFCIAYVLAFWKFFIIYTRIKHTNSTYTYLTFSAPLSLPNITSNDLAPINGLPWPAL